MNPLSVAILQSGIIDRRMLQELKKWGAPIEVPEKLPPSPKTSDEVVALLEGALDSEGMVLTRETDFDVLRQYLATQKPGCLHCVTDGSDADIIIVFGKTPANEYIVPWKGESIFEMMTNGETYLQDGRHAIYFSSVRDLFFGDMQAFMVCTPSTREKIDDDGS